MISHGDLDHRGGMNSIIKGMPVMQLLAGPSLRLPPAGKRPSTQRCERGQRWVWDGVEFEVLHPLHQRYAVSNESSCVLRVTGVGGSALLTGDIQSGSEAALVNGGLTRADIVVAAHHGSRTSSTSSFVDATRPSWALFAAGYRNRWDLPRPQVVRRWQDSGARTLATIDSGAIEIDVTNAGVLTPAQYRHDHRRYWSAR
jgi:competence protein ComEC